MTRRSTGRDGRTAPAANDDKLDMGDTRVQQGETPSKAPRLPHERDESGDSQADRASADDPVQRQAHRDVERGLVDTDKGPVIEKTYERVRGKTDTDDSGAR